MAREAADADFLNVLFYVVMHTMLDLSWKRPRPGKSKDTMDMSTDMSFVD